MNSELKKILLLMQLSATGIVQTISRIQLYGPDQMLTDETNMQMLEKNLGDFLVAMDVLVKMDAGVSVAGLDQVVKRTLESES